MPKQLTNKYFTSPHFPKTKKQNKKTKKQKNKIIFFTIYIQNIMPINNTILPKI